MFRILLHLLVFLFLTLLTQVGGIAWAIACIFKRRWISFVLAYTILSISAVWAAPYFGRVALSCTDDGSMKVQSWIYCALNRNYVSPELEKILIHTAEEVDKRHPGTVTLILDANFPFFDGFPLLPHLSHTDGDKVDIAFYYSNKAGYLREATRSPIGYFAFEKGITNCPDQWLSLRWNLKFPQSLWHRYQIDEERTRSLLQVLSNDGRIGKIFIEPHLVERLGVAHPKVRFQGCRAARHDDHIHIQL